MKIIGCRKPDHTAAERQRTLLARNERRGLKQVKLWVPAGDVEMMKIYAAQLRREHAPD